MVKITRIKHALLCALVATASLTTQATQQNKSLYSEIKLSIATKLYKIKSIWLSPFDLEILNKQDLSKIQLEEFVKYIIETDQTKGLFSHCQMEDIFSKLHGKNFFIQLVHDGDCKACDSVIEAFEKDLLYLLRNKKLKTVIICEIFDSLLQKASIDKRNTLIELIFSIGKSKYFSKMFSYDNYLTFEKYLIDDIAPGLQDLLHNKKTPTIIQLQHDKITTFELLKELTRRTTCSPYYDYCYTPSPFEVITGCSNRIKVKKSKLLDFFNKIIQEEEKLINNGYHVFFHSQQWEYLLAEKFYTDLWALSNDKKRPFNYLFPHIRLKYHNPLEEGPLNRKKLLKTGRTNANERQTLLFVNNSLLGNFTTNPGSSSLQYFFNNNSCKSCNIKVEDIFQHYQLSDLYEKYKKEIKATERLFYKSHYQKETPEFGNLLMIALPKNMVNDYCYVAETWWL